MSDAEPAAPAEPAAAQSAPDARRLHPATVLLQLIRNAPSTILALPAVFAATQGFNLLYAVIAAAVVTVVFGTFQYLDWRRFSYTLTDDAVVIESGLIGRNRRTIPFDRVQDVDIEQKLLARLFGLAKVTLETGGAGANEGALDSVSLAEAERLRGVVRHRAAQSHAAAGEPQAPQAALRSDERPAHGAVIFAMSLGRVLYSGLFRFSLVWLAVIGGAFQYVDEWLPYDISDDALWHDLSTRAETASHAAQAAQVAAAVAALVFIVMLLGLIAGVLRTLARDYGFTLSDEGGRFRRTRGLITRTEAVVSLRRVQLALIESGFFMRLLGWAGLKLQTLGSGEKGEGGRQDVAPFARPEEIDRVLGPVVLERADPDALTRVSSRHVWRMVIARIGWLLVPIVALAIARANIAEAAIFFASLMLLLLLLGVPVAIVAFLQRGHHRYGLSGSVLHVHRGVMGQKRWIVPVHNVQAITVRRSWLQRRLDTASVFPDTAGASMVSTLAVIDVRPGEAWALIEALSPVRRGAAPQN